MRNTAMTRETENDVAKKRNTKRKRNIIAAIATRATKNLASIVIAVIANIIESAIVDHERQILQMIATDVFAVEALIAMIVTTGANATTMDTTIGEVEVVAIVSIAPMKIRIAIEKDVAVVFVIATEVEADLPNTNTNQKKPSHLVRILDRTTGAEKRKQDTDCKGMLR